MAQNRPYLLLVNGPNLNRLGARNPAVYGSTTLSDIVDQVSAVAARYGADVEAFQSNSEGAIIDFLQVHGPGCIGVIINPGALGHYGLALRDCIEDLGKPTIEVHISNVHKREPFRHNLVLSAVATGQIVGLGAAGYRYAAEHLLSSTLSVREEGG